MDWATVIRAACAAKELKGCVFWDFLVQYTTTGNSSMENLDIRLTIYRSTQLGFFSVQEEQE
jgi:hypothetical protein